MVLHKKKDSREARSMSLTRYVSPCFTFGGSASMREIGEAGRGACLHRIAHEMLIQIKDWSKVRLQKGNPQVMQAGFCRNSDLHRGATQVLTRLSTLHRRDSTTAAIGWGRSTAALPIQKFDPLAIQKHFEFFARNRAKTLRRHVVTENGRYRDLVFALGRKNMPDQHSAPRSEGQSFDMVILRCVLWSSVNGQRRCRSFADGEPADLLSRRDISFYKCR